MSISMRLILLSAFIFSLGIKRGFRLDSPPMCILMYASKNYSKRKRKEVSYLYMLSKMRLINLEGYDVATAHSTLSSTSFPTLH